MTNVSNMELNMLKYSSTLAVSLPINLSSKLGFVSANGRRENYFMDELRILMIILFSCYNGNSDDFAIPPQPSIPYWIT